jgi:hypothetical protein
MKTKTFLTGIVLGLAATLQLSATLIQVTVDNLAPANPTGVYFSPVWFGFHDGTYDLFDPNTAASSNIEMLAELGNSAPINTSLMSAQPGATSYVVTDPMSPAPTGQFSPGHSATFTLDLDAFANRYLSFGLMVVPSNDTFLANAEPLAMTLFDAGGNFLGPQSWTFSGAQAWDAGTETNGFLGAAFIVGSDPLLSPAEGGMIHTQPLTGLDEFVGSMTPVNTTLGQALTAEPLLRISVASAAVPEPGTYGLMAAAGLMGLVIIRRIRRQAV